MVIFVLSLSLIFVFIPPFLPLRALYHQAVTVQRDFNLLVHKIAGDGDFLRKALEKTIEGTLMSILCVIQGALCGCFG